ncbi:MAG: MOSC domain-containing protein [Chloroflexota bacterium]
MEQVTKTILDMTQLNEGIPVILESPKNNGRIDLITIRPATNERVLKDEVEISIENGVEGDNWKTRGSNSMPDKSSNPEAKITIMNSRVIKHITQSDSGWEWAGDQFFVEMDLSEENLPAGQQLQLGTAVLEVSAVPHTGCAKFVARFGKDAHKFVNNQYGRSQRFRGVNLKVIKGGTVKVGDTAQKI